MKTGIAKIWLIFIFIAWSVPVFSQDKEEKSAISAIKSGDVELLKQYLEKHPDLNCEFSNGKTGLYYAIENDQIKISEFLLERGADPNFIVNDNSTLDWAIKHERARIIRLLIEYGADVNKTDADLNTPLILAAKLDKPELCKILIERGANPLHTNLKDKHASDFAIYYNESPTYKYLISMEMLCRDQDTLPSMHDGPYIYWEDDEQAVLTYYERDKDKNLTRIIEKTVETGKGDTIVQGAGWDKNMYHLKHEYTPDPYNVITNGNIFAVGDIHGRYDALVNILINNKIIDSDLKWIFGEGQLVLLGDVFDRGDKVTETLWFLYELQIQAQQSGGNVNLLLGNHEVMELTGDDRYLDSKYIYFTQYTQLYYFQLFEKNTVLGRWLRSKNVILRINDYLFMHAGISPQFAVYDFAYSDINSTVQKYLYSIDYKVKKGSPEDIILGPIGPQWYRGYSNINYNNNDSDNDKVNDNSKEPEVTQQFVDNYLSSKGLKRMILGHNPQFTIKPAFKGKVIFSDVEIDESGKSEQGLLISGDKVFRCKSDGTQEQIE